MNYGHQPSCQNTCKDCSEELFLRYCQKNLSPTEKIKIEEHFIEKPACWKKLINFNDQFLTANQNQSSHIETNLKIADLMMAEYFLKKKREKISLNSATLLQPEEDSPSTPGWENLTDAKLLASMFPVGKTTHFIVTKAWQEFFRRYEYTIIELISHRYKSIAPNQELSSQLLIHCIETVFKYLQKNNYKRLRSLRDLPEVPIEQFLKFATYKVLEEIEPFNRLSPVEQKFISSSLWRDKKALLINLHGSKSFHLFRDEPIKDEPKVDQLLSNKNSKPIFLRSANYFAAAALAVIASLPIGLLTYHLYNKIYQPINSTTAVINNHINSHQISNQTEINTPTSYDLFDQALDKFLQAHIANNVEQRDIQLKEAKRLAEVIATHGDNFGRDLYSFYKTMPGSAASELNEARRLSKKAENTPPGDNYDQILSDIDQANKIFIKFSDNLEKLANQTIEAKILNRQEKWSEANKLIDEGLNSTSQSKYLYIYTRFLLEKGLSFNENSDIAKATATYEEVVALADRLDLPRFMLKPLLTLSATYYTEDRNQECFDLSQKGLKLADGFNNYITVQLQHMAGVSAFNLGKKDLAEDYLNKALLLSQEQQNLPLVAQSYMFLGIINTTQNRLETAEKAFLQAFQTIDQLKEPLAKADMEQTVTGYYAREQMMAGNSQRALELYERSISLANKLNQRSALMLSQLYKGKAEALTKQGNYKAASNELQIAIALEKEAENKAEKANALLCFAVTCRTAVEQLNQLPY